MSELKHFVEMEDRYSKRRFAMRLKSEDEFDKVGDLLTYIQNISDTDLEQLKDEGRIGDLNVQGLEDVRTLLFNVNDDGSLDDVVEGVKLKQRGRTLKTDSPMKFVHNADKNIHTAKITINRDDVEFDFNWDGFYNRAWQRNPQFASFIEGVVSKAYGDEGASVLECKTPEAQVKFLAAVSDVFASAPYELYGRFIGRRPKFRNGAEVLQGVMEGKGGNCAEKASALDMIAFKYGIDGGFAFAGDGVDKPFPTKQLKKALYDWDFSFKQGVQKYWEHIANYFTVGGEDILIDATGGPFAKLFAQGSEAQQYFGQQKGADVTFITDKEHYFYHKDPDEMCYDLLWGIGAWEPNMDLQHVLGPDDPDHYSPFGLIITNDLWIVPDSYTSEAEFTKYKESWKDWDARDDRVTKLEVYPNLDPGADRGILTRLEESNPRLVADLRSAAPNLLKRVQEYEKSTTMNMYYVFAELNNSKA